MQSTLCFSTSYGCENALGNHRPCVLGNHAGYLQPYHRYHAKAGGGAYRPQNRRHRRPNADDGARGKETAPVEFTPYKPKIRKPGTGCVTMINDHLYEGRYTPTNAYGKRESHNIYAKTREECEEKLAEMIVQVKAQIKAEKDKMTG